jgi:hypothetical protein
MAECLTAWRDGEDSATAAAGALFLADALANLDACARFAVSYAKAVGRKG